MNSVELVMQQANVQQNPKLAKLIKYHESIAKQSHNLLEKIFASIPQSFQNKKSVTILVIGAGTFPSYISFLNTLCRKLPLLEEINFTLVEPVKEATEFFENYFAQSSTCHAKINFVILNIDIKEFLQHSGSKFDLVYFEHPEVNTFSILTAKCRFRKSIKTNSLRESIPHLVKILKPETMIMASCMSQHELHQLKWLLNFSLNVRPQLISFCKPSQYLFGGPYSSGLFCSISQQLPADLVNEKVLAIRRNDTFLCLCLLIGMGFYCLGLQEKDFFLERVFLVVLMFAQFMLHQPGIRGLLIKLFLTIAIITLCYNK